MKNILNYWYDLEFFNPSWPIDVKKDIHIKNNNFPWPIAEQKPNEQITFDIYIGKAKVQELIEWMVNELNLSSKEKIESDNTLCCLCALKVDEKGIYVSDTFAISSFIWGICEFVSKGYNHDLDKNELKKIESDLNNKLLYQKINSDFSVYNNIFQIVCKKILLINDVIQYDLWVKKIVQKGEKTNKSGEYSFPPIPLATELMSSFYIEDIEKIINNPTQRTLQFAYALDTVVKAPRIEIDTNTEEMKKSLMAERYPLGMWPSEFIPSLMQQIGINLSLSNEQSIFSVNGPPGTGKTTLLKEIVVSNIINRAISMCKFEFPDDAFTVKKFDNPVDEYSKTYYDVDQSLTTYGIIVASNNNAAVENISIELPKIIKKDKSGYFSKQKKGDENSEIYFSEIASKLIGTPSWGLISANLGKRENIQKFRYIMEGNKSEKGFFNYYKNTDEIPDWKAEKDKFNLLLNEVSKRRQEISELQKIVEKIEQLKRSVEESRRQYNLVLKEKNHCITNMNTIKDRIQDLEELKTNYQSNINDIISGISIIKRLLWKCFRKDPFICEWRQNIQKIKEINLEIFKLRDSLVEKEFSSKNLKEKCKIYEKNLKKQEDAYNNAKKIIEKQTALSGTKIADNGFWKEITKNEKSHEFSPWLDDNYNKMREKLFYQAMILHKAFILNSNGVKQNIKRLFNVWKEKMPPGDKKQAYSNLINTLLLVVPVISTTFASVKKFLDGIGPEELGLLIIDEAGQATPQSALGAIWRTKKSIIVGDPLQIEPILNVPRELQIRLADKYQINSEYKNRELSVQILGDALNRYGGYRYIDDNKIWLGCPLLVHRRCLEPMFTISNEVAYNNRMFQKTKNQKNEMQLFLNGSYWLDIKGKMLEKHDQNVKEQNEAVVVLFKKMLNNSGNLPDIFIITPFKKIKYELNKRLNYILNEQKTNLNPNEIEKWLDEHCGTIHTFQGKEANEVILVLGCDSVIGNGAAEWVGKKPNIINVAVSRAKFNICIIGDYDQWSKIPNISTACKYLERKTSIE